MHAGNYRKGYIGQIILVCTDSQAAALASHQIDSKLSATVSNFLTLSPEHLIKNSSSTRTDATQAHQASLDLLHTQSGKLLSKIR